MVVCLCVLSVLVSVGACWCLLAVVGVWWWLPVCAGACWAVGAGQRVLRRDGNCQYPSVRVGTRWFTLVLVGSILLAWIASSTILFMKINLIHAVSVRVFFEISIYQCFLLIFIVL